MCIGLGEFHVPCHSFFLSRTTERKAYSTFISRVSPSRFLPFQLKPFSRTYAPYLVARPEQRLGNRFLRCANRRWLKIKAPRILSPSLLHSPLVIFCLLVRYRGRNLPGDTVNVARALAAQYIERSIITYRIARCRRSTITFTTCHRYLSTDQDGARGKLLPE